MNNDENSRRNILGQIGFSLAGIVGLSSANNLFIFPNPSIFLQG